MAPMASGTYGWVQIAGRVVYKTNATVAADTAVGRRRCRHRRHARQRQAAAQRPQPRGGDRHATVTAVTTNGTGVLTTGGYDGFFLGMALSGTGIPASTVVAKLDPDGRTIYTGSAIGTLGDKNSTASGSITLTGTFTGFGEAMSCTRSRRVRSPNPLPPSGGFSGRIHFERVPQKPRRKHGRIDF
jgi:hypothetical protein